MNGRPAPLTDGARDSFVLSGGVPIYGLPVDANTRCTHYHGDTDVIAILFRCCDRFYPCHACRDTVADHLPTVWRDDERSAQALLCGNCGTLLSIDRYLEVDKCPSCRANFNPGCRLHHHLYFT